jgi:Tol biopolymer transport system component
MSETRELLERVGDRPPFPEDAFERMLGRRDRRRRNQRIAARTVGVAIAVVMILIATSVIRSSPPEVPATPTATRNGPIEVFGYVGGIREYGRHGLGPPVVKCGGYKCTGIGGASWSPDGSRLAFSAKCAGGCGSAGHPYHGIRIANPARGVDRLLLAGESMYGLSWSPDGTRIAYYQVNSPDDGQEWYVQMGFVGVDGEGPTRILEFGPDRESWPTGTLSWSPDSSELTYAAGRQIFIVGLDGSAPLPIGHGTSPAWSPDGQQIAYLDGCQVRAMAPDGTQVRPIVDLSTVRSGGAVCVRALALTWSPDGTRLAAAVSRQAGALAPETNWVFVVRAADGRTRQFSLRDNVQGIIWQPIL